MAATPQFLPYARPCITQEEIQEVKKALSSGVITRGPYVAAFEEELAKKCEARFAVMFHSGSAALSAAYQAANLSPYDRVITTPNTFVSTATPALQQKARHIFCDIDLETGNIDLEQVKYNLEISGTRGKTIVVPVHFGGIPVDMKKLDEMISDPHVVMIEDAAQALGSYYPSGEKVGSCPYSQMTIFSFDPTKTITTGEGGAVTTNDPILYHLLKRFRNNGIETEQSYWNQADEIGGYEGYYEVEEISNNFNVTEMQAALGLSQLKRLDQLVQHRRELISAYRRGLEGIPHLKMFTSQYDTHTSFELAVVQIEYSKWNISRKDLIRALKDRGIGTQVHYIPVYRHPLFVRQSGDLREYFPKMEQYYAQALSLPLFNEMSLDDVNRVCETLKSAQKNFDG